MKSWVKMDPSEINLIQRAQSGSIKAFADLMQKHDTGILKLAQFILRNPQDAQDVYQEVFLKCFANLNRFRYESSFHTWLTRIAINLCRNYLRRQRMRRWFSLDDTDNALQPYIEVMLNNESHPEELAQKNELWRKIQDILQTMPLAQRTAFTLKHILGYSLHEIAQIQECAVGTVKSNIFRATQKLKSQLQSYYSEDIEDRS